MSAPFVHLKLHTEYSIVDGLVRVNPLMQAVRENSMPAVAVTDFSNLFSLVKFYRAAINQGIKPIIGVDLLVAERAKSEATGLVTLLCMDELGYRNLTYLVTRAYIEGQYGGQPVVLREWLKTRANGLIALSGGREGDVGRCLLNGQMEQAQDWLSWWHELFADRYYIEIQRTGREGEESYVDQVVALAAQNNIALAATNDVRFIEQSEFEAHEARVCINQGRTLSDPRRPRNYSAEQYLKSSSEMVELFDDIPEAIANTVEIAKRCNVVLEFGNNVLPEFPLPEGYSTDEYLRERAHEGLDKRISSLEKSGQEINKEDYIARIERELDVIIGMGYPGYFLIVADFTQWARENGVPVGPGRGSGAGSLVAYALRITDIDPLPYDLLFERFLNPERVSMPDFDIDFCMDGRDRVIDYVANRYGREKVSQIITYGSMAAKAVVRDVGRVLGHPYGFVDRIAKMIPFEIGMTLEKALDREEELKNIYQEEEEVRALIDMARKLEGLARNAGKHAGGVVIAPSQLTDFTPLYCEAGGTNVVTQLDKDDVEAIGLVKFDFLGLRTLTIIDRAVQTINKRRASQKLEPIELDSLPLDDVKAYELLQRQETTAVFQLESSGIKDILKRLLPDKFDDIVALVALYRPGPLQSGMVEDFIDRKHGAAIEYPHPDLEPILNQTYGVILYQEQVMQIAQVLAGYTLGGADLLRRAMGKKKPEEMAKQREIFVGGATERGVEKQVADFIFDLMEKFAGYGFNKSHSVAYALLAYQTAWLKAHYPAEFMAAVLSSDMDNTDKVVNLFDECRGMGIEVLSPKVNQSSFEFAVTEESQILYGLGAIKGVGESAVEHLVEGRENNSEYESLNDLCIRIDTQKFNRRSLEAMIRAGAMDDFGHHRATLIHHLPRAMQLAEQHQRNNSTGQNDLFGGQTIVRDTVVEEQPEWDEQTKLLGEYETLGLYLTGHPVDQYRSELISITGASIRERMEQELPADTGKPNYRRNGPTSKIGGLLHQIRLRNSPSGRIAFLTIDDNTARMDVAVFSDEYRRFSNLLTKGNILIVDGMLGIDDFNGRKRMRAKEMVSFEDARVKYGKGVIITVKGRQLNGLAGELKHTLSAHLQGSCPVWLNYNNGEAVARMKFGDEWSVSPSRQLMQQLYNLPGVIRAEVVYM